MKDGYDLPPEAPGQYLPLRTNEPLAKMYLPERLPPRVELSEAVISECSRAMWALGRLEGLGSEVENPGGVFSSFVYKEAEQSSQVEGDCRDGLRYLPLRCRPAGDTGRSD